MNGQSQNDEKKTPFKSWGLEKTQAPKYVMERLYNVYFRLNKRAHERVGLMMKIPVFIQDPLVALENPILGIQEISVRLEEGFSDGPTSSRIAVVDFNGDTQSLTLPIVWNETVGWFHKPLKDAQAKIDWIPDSPPDMRRRRKTQKLKDEYKQFVSDTVKNPYFHQLNVWAIVQRVLEFYEEPQALGRPVPWGFDGNRLIIVPHAGYGENAFYDQNSKSLQFYYFGDSQTPGFTCLSHDIIAHETGHAILDGIRPRYNQLSSVQTGAFHEFIGDLTAILMALFNNDIRHFVAEQTQGKFGKADVLANIAEQFGKEVSQRKYLRTAYNDETMESVNKSLSPHYVSEVLTGAMFDILMGIAQTHLDKNTLDDSEEMSGSATKKVSPSQALWWAADRFRRVAIQPLDLLPPCDVQFSDYAKAVIRNDILTNPVDDQGYRAIMLKVFHERKICTCGHQQGENLPGECIFLAVLEAPDISFISHDIGRVSRSRTAAYYHLNDNRKTLQSHPTKMLLLLICTIITNWVSLLNACRVKWS